MVELRGRQVKSIICKKINGQAPVMTPAALLTPLGAKEAAAGLDATTRSSALPGQTTDLILCQRRRRRRVRGDQDKDKWGSPAWPSTMATGQ